MQKLLLIFFLFFSSAVFAQRGFLHVKKKGFKKVKSFSEGAAIKFETKHNEVIYGTIGLVNRDSVYVNGNWFDVDDINRIILREQKFEFDSKTFLLTTGGVVLSTAGMTLAKWTNLENALAYSAGIGYTNFLIRYFPKFKRKKYNIGKKFTLQTIDLHF